MTTNDLIAALQETLAKYQQNGVKEEDSTQRLESQMTDLKANVTQLQDALQAAQDEKRLLLETLREQSQQLLTLTQHVTTAAPSATPDVGEVKVASAPAPKQSSAAKAPVDEPAKAPAAKKTKTPSTKAKATPEKAPAKTPSMATKKGAKAAKPEPAPKKSKTTSDTPSLDQLWDMVRMFNAGKTFAQRIRFDENLAMHHFGFKPSEWKAWYKGTNSAKVKRQPPQVRTNQRKAAKEGIDALKQQWNEAFPSAPITTEEAPTSEATPEASTAPTKNKKPSSNDQVATATASVAVAEVVTTPAPQEQTATQEPSARKSSKTKSAKTGKASAGKKASKAPAAKKATKQTDKTTPTKGADNASPSEGGGQKAMQELFEFFQSWNQKDGNAAVRFTTHTAAAFDNIEIEQAREWIDQHPSEVKQSNEGIPPNNRREARQALAQLKETWSLL